MSIAQEIQSGSLGLLLDGSQGDAPIRDILRLNCYRDILVYPPMKSGTSFQKRLVLVTDALRNDTALTMDRALTSIADHRSRLEIYIDHADDLARKIGDAATKEVGSRRLPKAEIAGILQTFSLTLLTAVNAFDGERRIEDHLDRSWSGPVLSAHGVINAEREPELQGALWKRWRSIRTIIVRRERSRLEHALLGHSKPEEKKKQAKVTKPKAKASLDDDPKLIQACKAAEEYGISTAKLSRWAKPGQRRGGLNHERDGRKVYFYRSDLARYKAGIYGAKKGSLRSPAQP